MNTEHAGFRDPTDLTKWTRRFLCAYVAFSLVAAWSHAGALLGGGGPESLAALLAGIPLLDSLARLVGSVWDIVETIAASVITAILVLVWIHRANYNARQLGAADMAFSPGWAVGWHFVPIAWFWKPYQAMREIWQASVSPSNWRRQTGSPLLVWWWGLWILTRWGVFLATELTLRILDSAAAETADAAIELSFATLSVPLTLILLAIIRNVHQMQMRHHRVRSEYGGMR